VRGFAVTLSIGLMTSMFTAIMVTRLMVILYLRRQRFRALPI
jgi:preprotein translocase subunit SecD